MALFSIVPLGKKHTGTFGVSFGWFSGSKLSKIVVAKAESCQNGHQALFNTIVVL